MQKWSQILQRPIFLPQWQKIWETVSKSSRCIEQRETVYKIIFFWYRTPAVLHKYDPKVPLVCWRCQDNIGSLFHIFWDCPIIQPFWSSIQAHLQAFFKMNLPLDLIH